MFPQNIHFLDPGQNLDLNLTLPLKLFSLWLMSTPTPHHSSTAPAPASLQKPGLLPSVQFPRAPLLHEHDGPQSGLPGLLASVTLASGCQTAAPVWLSSSHSSMAPLSPLVALLSTELRTQNSELLSQLTHQGKANLIYADFLNINLFSTI